LLLAGAAVEWRFGPAVLALAPGCEVRIGAGLVYAQGEQARRFLEATGNPAAGNERVVAGARDLGWFVVFSLDDYETLNLLKPLDGKPDTEAIRAAIRRGSESANAERTRRGRETLSVLRFRDEPGYDASTGRLEWSLETRESGGRRGVNHFAYVLLPERVVAAELVTSGGGAAALAGFRSLLDGVRARMTEPPRSEAAQKGPSAWQGPVVAVIVSAGCIFLFRKYLRR
jgi:uncharacterized membrane-anchored protein